MEAFALEHPWLTTWLCALVVGNLFYTVLLAIARKSR